MKKQLLFLITVLLYMSTKAQNEEQNLGFTTYNIDTHFVSIAVDEGTNRVWAAARYNTGNAIVKLEEGETTFTTFEGIIPGNNVPLKDYFIRDIAIDFEGNLWVAHYGHGNNNVRGGIEKIRPDLSIKHYNARSGYGMADTGLLTRKTLAINVDVNDKIWATQRYQLLITTPAGAGDNTSSIWPGTLAFKSEYDFDFNVLGNQFRCNTDPSELPFPDNTFGESYIPQSAMRNFQALSSDDTEVWTSHSAYTAYPHDCTITTQVDITDRVLRYNLEGEYMGQFTYEDMLFPDTPADSHFFIESKINSICRNNEKGTWVSTNIIGIGFSVYKPDHTWVYINPSNFPIVIPPNTEFNNDAMWKDENGKVYMGTNNGLIVYNGTGPVDVESSYKIYTNYDYGADPTSDNYDSYVYDDTMSSRNIFGGCTDPRDPRVNWITTDNGIMKMGVREGVELWHIDDYTENPDQTQNEEEGFYNTHFLSKILNSNNEAVEEPMIAADGTESTIFRIYTDDPQGYYADTPIYKVFTGTENDIEEEEHIKQYGKFTILTPQSHEDYDYSMTLAYNISQFKYVDFLYQHPDHIDFLNYEENEIYGFIDFKIKNNNTNEEIVNTPIKIAVPPVLLLHGVWSSIHSMQSLENFFIEKNMPQYAISKAWRTVAEKDFQLAENSFENDAWVIPTYISELKDKAAKNKFSAGKVNIVAHSRGGLYARAYIEGISSSYPYKGNINSLITLDTPHFGSQGGNIALDHRRVPIAEVINNAFLQSPLSLIDLTVNFEEITLGDLMSKASVPKNDKPINGGENFGARNLLVEIDSVSGITPAEDTGFIKNLNSTQGLEELSENVPIHTIASIFNFCEISPALCAGIPNTPMSSITPKWFDAIVFIATATADQGPRAANDVVQEIFNNESNDFIVPLSSMIGGLPSEKSSIYGIGTPNGQNLDHTGMFGDGVTTNYAVQLNVLELLKSNVYDQSDAGRFYFSPMNHVELEYKFLKDSNFLLPANNQNRSIDNEITSKILINRDPVIFDNRMEGDVLNFNVYQEDVDRIMLTFNSENDSDNFQYLVKSDNLTFENPFSFTIPEGYSGELMITAYGYKNETSGYVTNTVTLNVGIPADVTLESIHFTTEEPIILEQDNYNYTVKGMYSDGIERIINNEDITFTIEEESVLSQVDANAVKGETVGTSLLKATFNGFEDTVKVKVRSNPSLQQTILTNLYAVPNDDNSEIVVNWITLHEYENASFVLETSYDTPDNFTEINNQVGNGTLDTPAQFNYTDTSYGVHTHIYYRIKMIDTQGNETYSSIIEVNLSSTAGVASNAMANVALSLYPNPTNTANVTLKLNSNTTDNNAKLEMYSLRGKRLSKQTVKVQSGANSFNLKVGSNLVSGIYFVKISTKAYVKTVKLIVE